MGFDVCTQTHTHSPRLIGRGWFWQEVRGSRSDLSPFSWTFTSEGFQLFLPLFFVSFHLFPALSIPACLYPCCLHSFFQSTISGFHHITCPISLLASGFCCSSLSKSSAQKDRRCLSYTCACACFSAMMWTVTPLSSFWYLSHLLPLWGHAIKMNWRHTHYWKCAPAHWQCAWIDTQTETLVACLGVCEKLFHCIQKLFETWRLSWINLCIEVWVKDTGCAAMQENSRKPIDSGMSTDIQLTWYINDVSDRILFYRKLFDSEIKWTSSVGKQ